MRKRNKRNKSKRGKAYFTFIISLLILTLVGLWGLIGGTFAGYEFKSFKQVITRGLDLQGGVSVLLEIQDNMTKEEQHDKLARTRQLLELRANKTGLTEPIVVTEGEKRIRIDIPGAEESKTVVDSLTKTGELKFVDPNGNTVLTGSDVSKAKAYVDDKGQALVSLEFNDEGKKKFADATTQFVGQKISIKLDDQAISEPTVQNAITNGEAVITGSKDISEARTTAGYIESGALPVTLKTLSVKTVGPTLGASALHMSVLAGIIGIGLVFLFMIMYYRVPGLMASFALCAYILLVLFTFVGVKATLTLPGIAGFLLTVGMAVDANVLIFESMKEECRNGKSVGSAIELGFSQAMSSIVDSNITTIIAALVLYFFGTGPVKGFATTLMIGIIMSMISAILITKFFIKRAFNIGWLNKDWSVGIKRRG